MADQEFREYYVNRLKALGVTYHTDEFLNPHNPLWPQQSFDYPYGQAPEVDDLPPHELADWEKYVAAYYLDKALGTKAEQSKDGAPASKGMAETAADYVKTLLINNGLRILPALEDDTFRGMLVEGLFSKFLCELDDIDWNRFTKAKVITDDDRGSYLKSDFSCMQVVEPTPGTNENLASSIAVVRRKPKDPSRLEWMCDYEGGYELVGIDIWQKDRATDGQVLAPPGPDAVDTAKELWRRSKYFVLQGALHRINLIDHIKVHFPHDTINAITKSVLPTWHPLHQLLMPHFWLTLPVNNAVLEGDRSLINRDTWYPWSPFASKGDVVRRLLPFAWAGAEYYGSPNPAFPPYRFHLVPFPEVPPKTPVTASYRPSVYTSAQQDYYIFVLEWARQMVAATLPKPKIDTEVQDLVWLEIQRWAHEIARFLPGFPDESRIVDDDVLAKVVAVVVWNASIAHSFDHGTLHALMTDPTKPMPFVIRVPLDGTFPTVETALQDDTRSDGGAFLKTLVMTVLAKVDPLLVKYVDQLPPDLKNLLQLPLGQQADLVMLYLAGLRLDADTLPLCSPADVLYSQMTDLLFYLPHNSSLLYDCKYAFDQPSAALYGRPALNADQLKAIAEARDFLQKGLAMFEKNVFALGFPEKMGMPHLMQPDDLNAPGKEQQRADFRTYHCVAAGIQY